MAIAFDRAGPASLVRLTATRLAPIAVKQAVQKARRPTQ